MIWSSKILRSRSAALALTVCLVGTLAACSDSGGEDGEAGPKQKGGTLKVLGAGQIDHLDPATSSFVPNMALMRAITRQLVSYKTTSAEDERITPQADLAVDVPEPTDGGTTYEFTLRNDGFSQRWEPPDSPGGVTGVKCNILLSQTRVSKMTVSRASIATLRSGVNHADQSQMEARS